MSGHQIYILPTSYGLYWAGALLLMLLGSLNYGSNIGLAFTFLFGSLALVGMLHTWRNLWALQLRVAAEAAPIFAGNSAAFAIRISEQQGLARGALLVTVDSTELVAAAVDVPPLGEADIELHPIPRRRGRYQLGTIRIDSSFPLGLFRAWAYAETTASVLVYPAPTVSQDMRPNMHFVPSDQGDRGLGVDDFVGLRPYRDGDPLRHLDWKALARERGLITRQFGGDRSEEIWLDWAATGPGDVEERLSRLCRMVLEAAALNLCYGVRLPAVNVEPATGDRHMHRCLVQLALFPPTTPHPAGVT